MPALSSSGATVTDTSAKLAVAITTGSPTSGTVEVSVSHCPGVIDTQLPRLALAGLPEDVAGGSFRGWEQSHVAGRIGTPEEVVAAAIFLASDEASFVTGAAIPVDSGVTAR